jgi:hypothetical protein
MRRATIHADVDDSGFFASREAAEQDVMVYRQLCPDPNVCRITLHDVRGKKLATLYDGVPA